jgi:hypothetical protein
MYGRSGCNKKEGIATTSGQNRCVASTLAARRGLDLGKFAASVPDFDNDEHAPHEYLLSAPTAIQC